MLNILNSLDQNTGIQISENELLVIAFIRAHRVLDEKERNQITMILKQATVRELSKNESTLGKAD